MAAGEQRWPARTVVLSKSGWSVAARDKGAALTLVTHASHTAMVATSLPKGKGRPRESL